MFQFVDHYLPVLFALIVGAAGWFYMFYSRAASKLYGVESDKTNLIRRRLRQIGGFAMVMLGAAFYAGYVALERRRVSAAVIFMFAVFALMAVVIILALVDLRLTNKLRKSNRERSEL